APGAAGVSGEEVRRESEGCVVGDPDALLLRVERDQARHRAERLLAGHVCVRRDARDHGRLEEGSAERVRLSADDALAASPEGVGDVPLDLLESVAVDQRPYLRTVLEA